MMVRIAVLGCGKIVPRFVQGLKLCDNATLVGFGSRDIFKAKEYADRFGAEIYGDYDRIMNDRDIDAVYIATYNPGHYELVSSALKHGKHVMCEKPLVPTKKELKELFELAREKKVLLMEACKGPFLPLNYQIRELVRQGTFGELVYVHGANCFKGDFKDGDWIFDPHFGGSLMDVGSYPTSILNYVLDRSPKLLDREVTMYNGTDGFAQALVSYGDGIQGHIQSGIMVSTDRKMEIYGTKGHLESNVFWRSGNCKYWVGQEEYELNCEMIDDFYYETHHFADCIQKGILESPIMSEQASLDILEIIGHEE